MAGTIIITGANGSLAMPAVEHLLTHFPDFTLVLTVRNDSRDDVNTNALRGVVARFHDDGNARASIRKLDLSSLNAVHKFTEAIADEIFQGFLPPLASIVCNAYYWNLSHPLQMTVDGYEKSMQVCHIAHVALVLRLLGSFNLHGGRIVLFASDAHEPGKNSREVIPPSIPTQHKRLELLAKPTPDDATVADNTGYGFYRFANAKLAVTTWGHALNHHLEKHPKLNKITTVIINPGNLFDSRALLVNTPRKIVLISKLVRRPLRPLLGLMDATMRTCAEAGIEAARWATNEAYPGERGYFTLLSRDKSSAVSRDEATQDALWDASARWADVGQEDTALDL